MSGLSGLTKKQKKMLRRILAAGALYAVLLIFDHMVGFPSEWIRLAAYAVPYLIAGYDVLKTAAGNIRRGRVFDENFLMTIATLAAFAVQEYSEAAAVMLFYQVGELFQNYAVEKSRRSITDMMDLVPETAHLEVGKTLMDTDPDDIDVGSIVVIQPGERVPLDGVVIEGDSMLDTAALTGESAPRHVREGDDIISGCVNGSGTLRVRTTSTFDDSTVARILELVEDAGMNKARVENFITRFAAWYTPVVTIGAVVLALIPPLFFGGEWGDWIRRACIFLIVSCPCALVISVPLGFFGGIGAASRSGILVKGSNYLEAASNLSTIIFDKTGTLTKGSFEVTGIDAVEGDEAGLLEAAAYAEGFSTHPIALSIRRAYGQTLDLTRVSDVKEEAGFGITARLDEEELLAGNAALMKAHGLDSPSVASEGTIIHVARGGRYLGRIIISDSIKPEAEESLRQIRTSGVRKTVMLTGDRRESAAPVAAALRVDEYFSDLLPGDKVGQVESFLAKQKAGEHLAFVGDGINDAPVLMRADVGIAMGSMGSDAAIEAADIVIMDDNLERIPVMIRIARKTMRIVRQNIVFALGVKILVLILGAVGVANMWEAVFADVGVAVIAILNSMRALNTK